MKQRLTAVLLGLGLVLCDQSRVDPSQTFLISGRSVVAKKARKLYQQGRLSEALTVYASAFADDPTFLRAALNAAAINREFGRNEESSLWLEKAVKLAPKDPKIVAELGWSHLHSGNTKTALGWFRTARALGKNPSALLGEGVALLDLGEYESARAPLKALAIERPKYAAAHYFLGIALRGAGDEQGGVEELENTVQTDRDFTEARLPLAEAYMRAGDWEKAWMQYRKIKAANPRHTLSVQREEELRAKLKRKPTKILGVKPIPPRPQVQPARDRGKIPNLRVGIGNGDGGQPISKGRVDLRVNGAFAVVGLRSGEILATGRKGERWEAVYTGRGRFDLVSSRGRKLHGLAAPVRIVPKDPKHTVVVTAAYYLKGKQGRLFHFPREYRGELEILPSKERGLVLVNVVNEQEYLFGVIPSEMPAHWALEALKAQAVIARGQIRVRKLSRVHSKKGHAYDLCDTEHCQAYLGVQVEAERATRAVEATRGEVLYSRNRPIESVFHSNCGGYIQSAKDVWGYNHPYLQERFDGDEEPELAPPGDPWDTMLWIKGNPRTHCNLSRDGSTAFRWMRVVQKDDMERRLNTRFRIGKLKTIVPIERTPSGLVDKVLVIGSKRQVVMDKEHQIRFLMGLASIRSNLFFIEARRGPDGEVQEFWVHGGGFGHGVGLCQFGAHGMGKYKKKSYFEILHFYFPNTELRRKMY